MVLVFVNTDVATDKGQRPVTKSSLRVLLHPRPQHIEGQMQGSHKVAPS